MADETPDEDWDDDDEGYAPRRRSWRVIGAIAMAVVLLIGLGLGLGFTFAGGSHDPVGPEGVPIQNVPDLASANTTAAGTPVDGMTCRNSMAATDPYHVHAHVDIFVNGKQYRIPAGAGITQPRVSVQMKGGIFVDSGSGNQDCLYWLHVHANDGIIHVEAPAPQKFVLGQFFDVWGQPLSADQVGPDHGTVVAFYNGQRWTGNPRNIPLNDHADIQLDVGSPVVAFKPLKFNVTGLCSTSCTALPTGSSSSSSS